jgi:CRP/FNR family transcriptional regulator, cyclic AMP receptor protein
MSINWGYVFGFIGAALMVWSYWMKNMLPLRHIALLANVFLVAYASLNLAWPTLLLYLAIFPVNIKKVIEIRKLVRAVQNAKADTPVAEWLLPHMKRRPAKAGELLWSQGDKAKEMVYLHEGSLRLVEIDQLRGPGTLLGEIGLFSPDNRRTLSVRCESDCTLFTLDADGVAQLYYIEPKLGFHVMQLVVERLQQDVQRARGQGPAQAAEATA